MKQLKFLMVALTLLMGIAFTSCLNSDDGEYDDIYGMVLVNNYMGLLSFEDAAGNTYQPTSASVTQFEANSSLKISDSRMGIILGKSIEPETNEKSKTTNFTLKNFQPISFANAVVSMTWTGPWNCWRRSTASIRWRWPATDHTTTSSSRWSWRA